MTAQLTSQVLEKGLLGKPYAGSRRMVTPKGDKSGDKGVL